MSSLGAHYRDSAGSQTPTGSFAAINFATEVNNDTGSNISQPSSNTFQIDEALPSGKAKLVICNIRFRNTRNNRGNAQAKAVLTSGTGNLWTTYETNFTRNSSNQSGWLRVYVVITNCSLNAQFQIQWKRDVDAITGGTIVNGSNVQIQDLYFEAIGLYTDTTGLQTCTSDTTRTTINLDNTVQETDTSKIQRSGNDVNVKTDGARYLVFGSIAGDNGAQRTSRNGVIAYNGTADTTTESYAYQRNANNKLGGMVLQDLYEKPVGADIPISLQCYRGPSGTAGDNGAAVAGSWRTTPGYCGLAVIELPSSAECFRSHDSTGGQTVSGVSAVTINAMRDEDFRDSSSYDGRTNSSIDANGAHKALILGSIMTGRQSTTSSTRGLMGARLEINGSNRSVGEHGDYSRGVQGSQNCFGWGASVGGVFDLFDNDTIELETFDAGDNGGTDQTNADSVSFFALNLDSTNSSGTAYSLTIDAGSYTLTGTDATFPRALGLTIDAGSYSLTGSDADFPLDFMVLANSGSYSVSGNDVGLNVGKVLIADPSSYALTGDDASLNISAIFQVDAGSYAYAGSDATLTTGIAPLIADAGFYNVVGSPATLTFSGSVGGDDGTGILIRRRRR